MYDTTEALLVQNVKSSVVEGTGPWGRINRAVLSLLFLNNRGAS